MISIATRNLYLSGSMLFVLAPGAATAAVPSPDNPNIAEVTPRVFALVGDMDVPNRRNRGFICNSAFVITNDGVVVVDPGGTPAIGRMVLTEIRKRTNKPVTHVINTHHHPDHWLGNQVFAELTPRPVIIGHAHMRATAQAEARTAIASMVRQTGDSARGMRAVLPNRELDGDSEIKTGGVTFKLYHPQHAHTPGDLAVYVVEERALIAGDIVFYRRTPGWQDASPAGNEAALKQFMALDIAHVVPGHGPVTDKSGIAWMLEYIHILRREVAKHVDAGLTDFEMKDKIDVGDYRDMSGFDTRFGINVNRMFLEVEAQGFAEP